MGDGKKAIIIGAGPGGLTAAIALRQAGFDPLVLERAAGFREGGSGLTIWPNAIHALKRIDLAEEVWSIGYSSDGIAMRSWRGNLLFEVGRGDHPEKTSGVYGIAVHRSELLDKLLSMLGGDYVKLGARCIGYKQDYGSVVALLEDGSESCGDLLIGADGINSAIRAQLSGVRRLRYAGYTVWRGVTRFNLGDSTGLTTMGRGAQFGLFKMTQDRVYWFASANAPERGKDQPVGRKRELLARFQGWHEPIEAIIEATDEAMIIRCDIYDLPPLRKWSQGRVTLLGDAAHPATPNLGQGACQAIEDAVVLAICLNESSDIASALKAYESCRLERTSSIAKQSWYLAKLGRWKSPFACWLREQIIRGTPERVRLHQLNQLFRFEP